VHLVGFITKKSILILSYQTYSRWTDASHTIEPPFGHATHGQTAGCSAHCIVALFDYSLRFDWRPSQKPDPRNRDRFARHCEVTKHRPSPEHWEQVLVVQDSVETGRSTRDVSICGSLGPLERDDFMCIKGGLVQQQWAQFAKQQHRHGLQGKRWERRARVSNSRTSSDCIVCFVVQ
jgi:hypothetical protein